MTKTGPPRLVHYWNGRPLEHCTKDELIDCIRFLINECQNEKRNHAFARDLLIRLTTGRKDQEK